MDKPQHGPDSKQDGGIVIVTGLSGAGKSTALSVFEDLGFFTVDGLPATLAPEMANLLNREPMRHFRGMAIGMDLRQEGFLEEFTSVLDRLAQSSLPVRIVFLEATDQALLLRYAATRRPHPLERSGLALEKALRHERRLLEPVRERANLIIDSTNFNIHDLRRDIQRKFLGEQDQSALLRVNLISFGFKYGLPTDADFVFDLRFLDNPYFVESLRPLSGKDKAVAEYVFKSETARKFAQHVISLLIFTLEVMALEGRYRVTIAFGCTGGRHRSVAMTEEVGQCLRQKGFAVSLEHRNLERDVQGLSTPEDPRKPDGKTD